MKIDLDTPACVNGVIGTSNRLQVQGNFPQYQRERVISRQERQLPGTSSSVISINVRGGT